MPVLTPQVRALIETAVYGALGATALSLLHVPAGALVGAMLAVGAASLAGRHTGAPHWVQTGLFLVVGSAVGAGVTPDALGSFIAWPMSLVILIVATAAICFLGYWIFRKLGGCSQITAFYAAAPGAFSTVMVMAHADGADMAKVAVAQVLRIIVVTAASPLFLAATHLQRPIVATHQAVLGGPLPWVILAAGSLIGWRVAHRLKWPTPAFMGPMAVSALLHVTGVMALAVPRPIVIIASAGLGAIVGTRFRGVSPRELAAFFPTAMAALAVMGTIGLGAGWFAGTASGVGPAAGILAFAPGSMDVMIAIALATAASPAYVAAHHTARLLGLLAALPLVARGRARAAAIEAAAED